ncbi:MAG: ThiF family adenylyltransferase [Gemmatimonadaceae bacterium]|nr:ThiF family adenylyltransferase [Gemmatimonadaceae bacterium]
MTQPAHEARGDKQGHGHGEIDADRWGGAPVVTASCPALVRASAPEWNALMTLMVSRYPNQEWATFARFGWRETPDRLILTLASLDAPSGSDLDASVSHVRIQEPYSLRVALAAETHDLAVGVIHSHPEGAWPTASVIDDDMDAYYASYFLGFAPARPYVSLIFARDGNGNLTGSGRVFFRSEWYRVDGFHVAAEMLGGGFPDVAVDGYRRADMLSTRKRARVARLATAFGDDAAARLSRATVAVIGASGTGSPAIEVLARAGVGHLIIVDPDRLVMSNLERVHGSEAADLGPGVLTPPDDEPASAKTRGRRAEVGPSDAAGAQDGPFKAAVAARHVRDINPDIKVTVMVGRLPQKEVLDLVCAADVVIGATDQQHARVALSDIALRYCVPVLDTGVVLEGADGKITGQAIQLTRFLPDDACVYCRHMVSTARVSQELMSPAERAARRSRGKSRTPTGMTSLSS